MMKLWVVRTCRGQLTKRSEYHKKISGFSLILSFSKFGYNDTQDFIQVLHIFNEHRVFAKTLHKRVLYNVKRKYSGMQILIQGHRTPTFGTDEFSRTRIIGLVLFC